jgi:hypothetical protein
VQLAVAHKTVRTVVVVDFKFPVLKGNKYYNCITIIKPVAMRSMACVYGRSLTGIVGSNPA